MCRESYRAPPFCTFRVCRHAIQSVFAGDDHSVYGYAWLTNGSGCLVDAVLPSHLLCELLLWPFEARRTLEYKNSSLSYVHYCWGDSSLKIDISGMFVHKHTHQGALSLIKTIISFICDAVRTCRICKGQVDTKYCSSMAPSAHH